MAKFLRERTTNWSGGMLDSGTSADDFAASQCSLLYNARTELDGSVGCVGGSRLLSATPATATTYGRGIVEFKPSTTARELVKFTSNGTNTTVVYSTDSGKTWAAVATLNAIDGDWSLATMTKSGTNYLLGACGTTELYKYSGGGAAGWGTFAAKPVANCKYVAVHNERCWASTGDSNVYGSKIADFETWADPDGLTLPVQTHDGDNITGIFQAGSILLVTKRHSVSYIDGFGESDIIVAAGTRGISGGSAGVGCIAPRTFQAVGNGWVWLSERGIEFFDGQSVKPIATGAYEYLQTIARNRITEATGTGSTPTLPCSVYWPEMQEYWIAWPSSAYASTDTTVVNDEGLLLNMRTGATHKRVWNPPGNTGSRKLHPGAMCLAEVTVDDESYVRPVVLTKYGDTLAMDLGTTEMEGTATALPTLTSGVLILDADREAWRRGMTIGDSLALSGLTLTDDSGEGNDCTGGGSLLLIHDGASWVFRFASTNSFIAVPAIDYSGAAVVTVGIRATWQGAGGTPQWLMSMPKEGGAVANGFSLVTQTVGGVTMSVVGATKGDAGINQLYTTAYSAASGSGSVIAVMDKAQAAVSETVFYVGNVAAATASVPGAVFNNTNSYANLDGRIGGIVAGTNNFVGDMARITIQTATPGAPERGTLNTYLGTGVQGASEPYAIDARVRTRVYDFGEPDEQKWWRRADVTATESANQTVSAYPITDGTAGGALSMAFGTAVADEPLTENVRVSQRGTNHQLELRFAGGMKISAVRLQAMLLRGELR